MPIAKKLPSGSWRCQVYSHSEPMRDPDGNLKLDDKGRPKKKRIYESFYSSDPTRAGKYEAERLANDFMINRKRRLNSNNLLLVEAIEEYIKIKNNVLSASTIAGYRKIQKYAFKNIMCMKLNDINTAVILQAVNEEAVRQTTQHGKTGPISPKTLKNEYGLLSAVLSYYEIDYSRSKIILPQIPKKHKELPAPNQIYAAVKGTEIELAVLLAMWLSFSESEVAGLKKSTSLLEDGKYIAVNDVVLTIDGKEVAKETGKRPTRQRVLKIPKVIKDLIDQSDPDEDRLVPIKTNTLYKKLVRYTSRAGLPHITFHDLRHVNASVMALLHVPDKYAMERGGWSTDYVMKHVYTHTFSDQRNLADQVIDSYFEEQLSHEVSHAKRKKP
ncbi:MAG: tyrosine-type recombinase/integrase [Lachnospiraceae bacterium]|nr:tyrosine-type recombinase/integrase [Lachnospiraceae bacterium]